MSTVAQLRPTTVTEAVEAFKGYLARRRRDPKTIKKYEPILRDFAAWAGDRSPGSVSAAEIDTGFLVQWEAAFVERRGRQPSDNTIRAVIGCLSSLYNYLRDYGLLVDDDGRYVPSPMTAIETPKIEAGPPDWLKPHEDEKLLATPMNDQEEILVWFYRWTGARVDEGISLRMSDIDFLERTITIRNGKFGKSRVIPIVPELLPRLNRWISYLQERGLYDPRGPFLPTRNRTPMKFQFVHRLVVRVGERAGLERRLTPHTLRRTFGSDLLNRGLRIEVVSKLLGHSNVAITQKAYAVLLDETVKSELLAVVGGR